ncbi:hypothetical protein BBJ28_00011041 [Nothophytophthora sp. Chile5]|nr:hypothetical protein BBJ28_00011041 [Nothophytophthora sp. Chile5]
MAVDSAGKKRPRADLLSSLDAAFASASQAPASKYTVQAAAQIAAKGNKQQAYQHSKRKRRDGKRGNGNGNGNGGAGQAREKTEDRGKDSGAKSTPAADPLYEKLDVDLLAVGLKDCSLRSNAKTLANLREMRSTFKRYLETITQGTSVGSTAVDQLKNKVMSLDNPIKTPSAGGAAGTGQAIAAASLAQTSKLLGARRRRQLGLHLLKGEMKYSNAEELQAIWMRYVRRVIDNELSVVETVTKDAQRARNAKLQTKLKLMDLSGCPLEGLPTCSMVSTVGESGHTNHRDAM